MIKVSSISIQNYRCIDKAVKINIQPLAVLVGKNDTGKSTILRSLESFFNPKQFNWDDQHTQGEPTEISVTCEIAMSHQLIERLRKINLLSQENTFRMRRMWEQRGRGCRTSLWNFWSSEWIDVPSSGNSAIREVAHELAEALPSYQYFHARGSLQEAESAIQQYLRRIIQKECETNPAVLELQRKLETVIEKELESITEKIRAATSSPEILNAKPGFNWSKVLDIDFTTGEKNLAMNSRGDGFQRIAMLSYFEYLAEKSISSSNTQKQEIIFAIEEPETYLHPSAQETLFSRLAELAHLGYQVLITSHSPIIVAQAPLSSLIHVQRQNNFVHYQTENLALDVIIRDLGITPDSQLTSLLIQHKGFILVEGKDDVIALSHTSQVYKKAGEIEKTFEEMGVIILPVGGCGNIKHWLNLQIIQRLNKPFIIFFDSDRESRDSLSPRQKELERLDHLDPSIIFVTRKRTIENYILDSVVNRLNPSLNLNYTDFDNIKKLPKSSSFIEKYFEQLTFADLKAAFAPNNEEDEFLGLYYRIYELVFSIQ